MSREFFLPLALEVAPKLLGAKLTIESDDGPTTIRITEVEAYHGVGTPPPYDPGSHARDHRTDRNASMFGEPGHAYVYQSYGMHFAINLVCAPEGMASGVLLRAGEVIEGQELAQHRRGHKRSRYALPGAESDATGGGSIRPALLARGPGNLAAALGINRETHNGLDLFSMPFRFAEPEAEELSHVIKSGPRVGVSGVAGGPEFPWRFWIAGDPTVSAFRPGRGAPRV